MCDVRYSSCHVNFYFDLCVSDMEVLDVAFLMALMNLSSLLAKSFFSFSFNGLNIPNFGGKSCGIFVSVMVGKYPRFPIKVWVNSVKSNLFKVSVYFSVFVLVTL